MSDNPEMHATIRSPSAYLRRVIAAPLTYQRSMRQLRTYVRLSRHSLGWLDSCFLQGSAVDQHDAWQRATANAVIGDISLCSSLGNRCSRFEVSPRNTFARAPAVILGEVASSCRPNVTDCHGVHGDSQEGTSGTATAPRMITKTSITLQAGHPSHVSSPAAIALCPLAYGTVQKRGQVFGRTLTEAQSAPGPSDPLGENVPAAAA